MKTLKLALLSSAALFLSLPALADSFTVSLTPASPSVAAGSTYTFNGTISAAAGNGGALSLLGDAVTVDAPLTSDDSLFYIDTPTFLAPGQVYTGALFTVTLPSSLAAGAYLGNLNVLAADSANNLLSVDTSFSVNAVQAVAATPEPGSWLLLSTGLGAVAVLRRRFAGAC